MSGLRAVETKTRQPVTGRGRNAGARLLPSQGRPEPWGVLAVWPWNGPQGSAAQGGRRQRHALSGQQNLRLRVSDPMQGMRSEVSVATATAQLLRIKI
jgi:hypothetical protein